MQHTSLRFVFCSIVLSAVAFCSLAFANNPSYISGYTIETAISVSPEDWLALDGEIDPQPSGASTNEVQITPEIRAMARALENDPVKIYEYVRNQVDYIPLFGARNGATATLISKRGNDVDQSALLIALLKAADPASDAEFVRGIAIYSTSFLADMLNVNSNQVRARLAMGLIPSYSNSVSSIQVFRYWVEATVNGTNVVLDAAYKEYISSDSLDLLSIAGYTRTQFMARAVSGATVTTNSIRNASEANIRADLTTYSSNLAGYIQSNYPNDDISAVLGGRKIKQQAVSSLPTFLPYAIYVDPNAERELVLPSHHYWKLTIQHQGIDETMSLYEFAGKRVSIFYTGSGNAPELRVDGDLIATGNATTTGQVYSMATTLSRLSPFAPGITNNSHTFDLTSGQSYLIANDFGTACPFLIGNISEQLARDREAGLSETSEAVRGGAMHLMALSYFSQLTQQKKLISQLTQVPATDIYAIGLVAQEEGYYIDIPMAKVSLTHTSGDFDKAMAFFRTTTMLHSALEHGMLEQMQGTNRPAVSTVKLLALNNATNKETYFATSANWAGAGGVRTQLVNYTSEQLTQLDSDIGSGVTAVLPKDAAITLAQWSGPGYIIYNSSTMGMLIQGGLNGGFGAFMASIQSMLAEHFTITAYMPLPPVNVIRPESIEPVDLASGDYLFENVDLEMGGREPRGIRFVRHYNSSQSTKDSRLRYGWTHNYDMRAVVHSNPELVLGGRQATDAASMAVYSLIVADLMENELNAQGWVTTSLAANWAMDQMIDNAVNIRIGNKSLIYTKLPDGSYNPPPAVTATLTRDSGAFCLKERLDTQYDFNTNNLISTWRDADSNTLSFVYNAQTNLSAVSNAYGRELSFTYSGATQLTSVADSSGRTVSYGYTDGNLMSYTDPEANVWTYTYDSNHWMRTLANPLSQMTATNTYDAMGMVVTQKNGAGYSWAFFVVPKWRSIEQDPYGGQIIYTFDDKGRQVAIEDQEGNSRTIEYDGQGHVTNEIDPRGFPTRYDYDANHNRTHVVDALTNATAFVYDSQHRLVSVSNALGHVTQYGYDAEHHITNVVDALTNAISTTYTADGLPQTVTGSREETTSYTYDSYGNPATIFRTDGGTETRTWNARGDLLTLTDANTNTTTFTYDKRRLRTSIRDPYQQRITNLYNDAGLLVTNIDRCNGTNITTYTPTYKVASIQYPDDGIVSNVYDEADRLIRVRDPMEGVSSNGYDQAGRLIWTGDPLGNVVSNLYDANGNVVALYDADHSPVTNQYDELNRLLCTADVLEHSISNQYNELGWLTATWDQNRQKTEFEHDALGRITLERRGSLEHTFEYDASGNRMAYINPKDERMSFGYDKMNRRVAETNALLKGTSYRYDPVGNLTQKVNANSQTNAYTYDALNRLSTRQSATENVFFAYDANGNRTNMVDSLGTTRQTFDAMNRPLQITDVFGQTVSNQYNLAGRRTQITYPGGKIEQFGYDGNRRLTQVLASDFGLSATTYSYDSRNNLTGASLPGGLTATNSYDELNRRLAWSVSKAGSNLLSRTCTRNPLGFRTNEIIAAGLDAVAGPASQTRTHDAANRIANLTQSGPSATNTPLYDAVGNVTQLVRSVNGQTFTTRHAYDGNGRLTATTRLRNAPDGSSVTTSVMQLEYDGQGLLLRITEEGIVRRLVRDQADPLARPLVETDSSGNPLRYFLWANGKLLAQVETNGTIRLAHSDELGRTLALTDGSGAMTDEMAYHPYGQLIAHSGTNDIPFAYMGDYGIWNAGNGLFLTLHRAYDATLMRFLQPDPIGLDAGYNLYAYAEGNPVWFIDPLGLDAIYFVGGNSEDESYFSDKADAYASAYRETHPGEYTHIVQVASAGDFREALAQYSDLNQVTYVGHSYAGNLNIGNGGQPIRTTDIYSFPTENINPGAEINLWGCNTAVSPGGVNGESTAQAFANHFNTSVNAINGGLSFGLPFPPYNPNFNLFTLWPSLLRGDQVSIKPNM